jgi:hypothetical protein
MRHWPEAGRGNSLYLRVLRLRALRCATAPVNSDAAQPLKPRSLRKPG